MAGPRHQPISEATIVGRQADTLLTLTTDTVLLHSHNIQHNLLKGRQADTLLTVTTVTVFLHSHKIQHILLQGASHEIELGQIW